MNIARSVCLLALVILGIVSTRIAIEKYLTVEPVTNKENIRHSRHHVLPLGQEDEDVLVFVHVRISEIRDNIFLIFKIWFSVSILFSR